MNHPSNKLIQIKQPAHKSSTLPPHPVHHIRHALASAINPNWQLPHKPSPYQSIHRAVRRDTHRTTRTTATKDWAVALYQLSPIQVATHYRPDCPKKAHQQTVTLVRVLLVSLIQMLASIHRLINSTLASETMPHHLDCVNKYIFHILRSSSMPNHHLNCFSVKFSSIHVGIRALGSLAITKHPNLKRTQSWFNR